MSEYIDPYLHEISDNEFVSVTGCLVSRLYSLDQWLIGAHRGIRNWLLTLAIAGSNRETWFHRELSQNVNPFPTARGKRRECHPHRRIGAVAPIRRWGPYTA